MRWEDEVAHRFSKHDWSLILGGSSGFGLATARKLAAHGMNQCIVHRDRRAALPRIHEDFEELRKSGVTVLDFNRDATSAAERATIAAALEEKLQPHGRVRLLMHSIAFGNLKPITAQSGEMALSDDDFQHTVHAMGTSLVGWVQEIMNRRLFAQDARVVGMTSEGNAVAWKGYAAVSAAKAALESASRSLAVELASYGLRSNVVQAGITDTPALRLIPQHEQLKASAKLRNPFGRLTTPEDVANVVYLLALDEAAWINGALIRVDGGEHVAGI